MFAFTGCPSPMETASEPIEIWLDEKTKTRLSRQVRKTVRLQSWPPVAAVWPQVMPHLWR